MNDAVLDKDSKTQKTPTKTQQQDPHDMKYLRHRNTNKTSTKINDRNTQWQEEETRQELKDNDKKTQQHGGLLTQRLKGCET